MRRFSIAGLLGLVLTLGFRASTPGFTPAVYAQTAQPAVHPSVVEHDREVIARQPGPHEGGGETTAYQFFAKAPDVRFAFRKRAIHKGSGIGHHEQKGDEVYYVLSGNGQLTLNGETREVGPGTAILTRPGSTHSLKQIGDDDLVIIITYPLETLP